MADVKSLEETDNSTAILPPINVVLQQFIQKLSHQVEEIRVRALKNILFKLEHKLICVSDLVQERELLIRLLEWFNSPSAPLKKEVLELLEKLSKHVSAAQILLSIGTIEFLSQLRQDISPDLYQDVDNVIHQLLRLPQDVDDKHDEWCLYKGHGVQPGNNDAVVDTGTSENGRGQLKSSSCPILSKEGPPHGLASSQSIPQFGKPQGYFAEDLVPIPSQSNMPQGSRSTSRSHDTAQLESTALTFFRWMSLSVSDRHVLTATDSRLQSRSPTLVAQSCEFLSDVLFKDFPAEIFLQRPSVFRTLLDILDTSRNTTDDTLLLSTLNCLTSLCQHVQRRLMATSDPALFCPDNDCWKRTSSKPTAGVPSQEMKVSAEEQEQIQERESGDGGQSSNTPSPLTTETDGASLSAGEEEEEDLVVEALQYDQLSVEEVCIAVLSKAIPATTGVLCDNARVVIACLELLFHVGDLLRMVTPVDLWDEDSQTYKVMGPSLISSFRSLGDAIALHMRKSGYHGDVAMVTPSLSNHRMAVVNLTAFTVQLIQALVPLEQAPRVMSSGLVTVLSMVSIDGVLARTHRHLHAAVLEYLNVLDRTSYQVYTYLSDICQSIVDTCKLLKFATEKAQGGSISDSLALLDKSLPSLAYHKHMGVVREGVRICSRACSSANADPSVVKTSRKVILNILAHYDSEIRLEGYRSCLGVVTEALKVSHVTYPVSTVCQGMVVLLADDVVTQICRYGLYDPDTKIQEMAVDLLENMLLGRLSMSTELWRLLLLSITPSLPTLQAYIGQQNTLDQCVLDLITLQDPNTGPMTADGEVLTLAPIEQLRGSLRLMFSKNPNIRVKGLGAVAWFLMTDASQQWGQRFFKSRTPDTLRDIFIVDQLVSTMNRHAGGPHPSMDKHVSVPHPSTERADITKLWEIYSSRGGEWSIRKSAAEQLAIIMQDPHWHSVVLDVHGDEVTLDILREILSAEGGGHTPATPSPSVELVPACLKILRLLCEFNWSCRHRLARYVHVYTIITMATATCQPSAHASYEGACLMTLLLFDELGGESVDKDHGIAFSLPGFILKSFKLPFNPPVCDVVSKYQAQVPKEPDPARSGPGVSMLRVAWNLGWYESLEKLCAVEGVEDWGLAGDDKRFWQALRWRTLDSHILRSCYTTTCIADQLTTLQRAASHHPARRAVGVVRTHLITDLGLAGRGSKLAVETVYTLQWQEALERYLQVLPNNTEDDELLLEILSVLSDILTSPSPPPEPVVAWMARVVINNEGPLLTLLRMPQNDSAHLTSEAVTDSRRTLRKTLLAFLSTLVKALLRSSANWRFDSERVYIGDLAYAVALNLDLADNPQYYDLPVLESALECLGHVTSRSHWSTHAKGKSPMELCSSMLRSLIQVVTAFHAGRLGSRSSFMGKGVTIHACLCLTHLAREMQILDPDESWAEHWLRARDTGDQPLNWLVTLWSDRSPEVRWMGLSIASTLVTCEAGQGGLVQALQGDAWAVFAVGLTILMSDGDCGMVRHQAAHLVRNFVRTLIDTSSSQKSGIPSSSGQAVQVLLDHYQFYSKIATLLTSTITSLRPMTTSSRACQSTASGTNSTTTSGIPYQPLASNSRSVSVTSEMIQNALQSPESNGVRSPGEVSTITLSSGSILSPSVSAVSIAHTQTPTSVLPLINERGLPSGMSTTNSSAQSSDPSVLGSVTSVGNLVTSSLTPGFLGALAELVRSLVTVVPSHTLTAIKKLNIMAGFYSHLDSSELQTFLQAQKEQSALPSSMTRAAVVVVGEVMEMYASLVLVTHVLARVDHSLLYDLRQDSRTLHNIAALFVIDPSFADIQLKSTSYALWLAVSRLFVTMLQTQGPVTVPSVTEKTLYKFWTFLVAIFKQVMADMSSPLCLRASLLGLLTLLMTVHSRRAGKKRRVYKRSAPSPSRGESALVQLLDKGNRDDDENGKGESTGIQLCSCLMKALDDSSTRPSKKEELVTKHAKIALTSLLAVSQTSKASALKDGLVETTLDQIKHIHVQLNMDSLQLGRGPSWKKRENPLIDEMVACLDVLRNLVYQYEEGKLACMESGLIGTLYKLWAWCTVESNLMSAVLLLLSTLTARCPKVAACIAGGSSISRASQSGTTFLNNLLKTASSTNRKILSSNSCPDLDTHLATHKALFTLLANLAMSAECRGIIWKVC
ncbi:rotatin-like isoform X2 [Nematostella vectensis]|uniref:rotatin-like isoform X2 n=1 Tax=Nematostella vectensis TaxID=45351 RepID=UPI00207724ED|nr:rotatin-like isoform X2 [Nematostella vectensis]